MPGRTCQNVRVAICDLQPWSDIEAYVSDINDDAKYVSLYSRFRMFRVTTQTKLSVCRVLAFGSAIHPMKGRLPGCRDPTSVAHVSQLYRDAVRVFFKESDALIYELP